MTPLFESSKPSVEPISADTEAVFLAALRMRASTPEELSELSSFPLEEVLYALEHHRMPGLLEYNEGRIKYSALTGDAVAASQELLNRQRVLMQSSIHSAQQILDSLPYLLRIWGSNKHLTNDMEVRAWHGERAAENCWIELFASGASAGTQPKRVMAMFPNVERMGTTSSERTSQFIDAMRHFEAVRAILPASLPEFAPDQMHIYSSVGVTFRSMVDPPSWFWVDSGGTIALPFSWGDAKPTSVLAVTEPNIAAVGIALFEVLWSSAQPVDLTHNEPSWRSLLLLMSAGFTLESASARLGVNPRTGRRRVAAAMEHFGTKSLFALGAALAAEQSGTW